MFSLCEASFIASSKSRLHKLKRDGHRKAKALESILDRKEKILSVVLFGNNAVNIIASSVVTIIAIEYTPTESFFHQYAVGIGSFFLTFTILIFAEIVPKTIAISRPEKTAISVLRFYIICEVIIGPLVLLVNKVVKGILKILNFKHSQSNITATDTIRSEIEYHHLQGAFVKNDRDMLDGVLNLIGMDVESVMTHRKDVDMIDINNEIDEVLKLIQDSPHTRIPVYEDTPDEMLGILHLKDFFILTNSKKNITINDIRSILLKPIFVPLNTKLRTQLMEFKKKKSHMAIVVDEYGGMMGIVTLEDIIEEVVGTIHDEHAKENLDIIKEKDGSYIVNGECQINDFNRETDSHFNYEDASTMAGLVIDKAEKIPEEGEEFIIMNHRFTVIKKDKSKINVVKVEKLAQEDISEIEQKS